MASHGHSQTSAMGTPAASPYPRAAPNSFYLDQSATTPQQHPNNQMAVDQEGHLVHSEGLWSEDVLNRKSSRMDYGEEEEAVHSDEE